LFSYVERFLGTAGIDHNLGLAIPITQVNKNHAAHVASPIHPSGQRNLLAYIFPP
jgi:hypothetical protein